MLLLVAIFFVIVGGASAANPRLLWRATRWQYKNPDANEPSNKAYIVQRVAGALFAVLGLVLIVVAITKL